MARPIPPATLHRIVEPWSDPRSYAPDPVEMLRANARKPVHVRIGWFATLAADWREIIDEISEHPLSHLLVGLATFLGVTLLLIIPTLIGMGK